MTRKIDQDRIRSRLRLANLPETAAVSEADYERLAEQQRKVSSLEKCLAEENATRDISASLRTTKALRHHRRVLNDMVTALNEGKTLDSVDTSLPASFSQ